MYIMKFYKCLVTSVHNYYVFLIVLLFEYPYGFHSTDTSPVILLHINEKISEF